MGVVKPAPTPSEAIATSPQIGARTEKRVSLSQTSARQYGQDNTTGHVMYSV